MNALSTAAKQPNPPFRLLIGVPDTGHWCGEMGQSIVEMVGYLLQNPIPGYGECSADLMRASGSILPDNRNALAGAALEGNYSHLLFVDTDMTFPADTVHRLAALHSPIAATNPTKKTVPPESTAARIVDGGAQPLPVDAEGVVEVDVAGCGVMLIRRDVLRAIPQPWFAFHTSPTGTTGEDWVFCLKARKADFAVTVDLDLSRDIGHVGTVTYRLGR